MILLINEDARQSCEETDNSYFEDKMQEMQRTIQISTYSHNDLCDITHQVEGFVSESDVKEGLVNY